MISGDKYAHRRVRSSGPVVAALALSAATIALAPAVATAAPAPTVDRTAASAASPTPSGGTYAPLAQQARVFDSRDSTNSGGAKALAAGGAVSPTVVGVAGVPAAGVGSVAVTITAWSPTATGALVAYPYGTSRPATTTLRFAKGQRAVTGSTIVRVVDGRITVHKTGSSGSVQVTVDLSGYFRSGTASTKAGGIFHPVTPRRFVDTRSGYGGVRKARVAAGKYIDVRLGGRGDLPATPGVAAMTVTAVAPTKAGTITGGRTDEPQRGYGYANFEAGETVSAFAPMRVANGVTRIVNSSSGTVDFTVDVVGYWTLGFAEQAYAFQTRVQTRAPQVYLPGGGSVTVELGGYGGVERSGVAAVVATLHALAPRGDAYLQASRPGADGAPSGSVLQYEPGRSDANVVFLPSSGNGSVILRNTSPKAMKVAIDINGYVPSVANRATAATATARYLDAFTGSLDADRATMATYGATDGAAGRRFVLLHVGAQSVSAPVLSTDHPGVSISKTSTRVAYTYADLIELANSYLGAYLAAPGHAVDPTIAIGTNNDGAGTWDPATPATYYEAGRRGTDWANTIRAIGSANPGARVRGANDIEPGFASTVAQAEAWESAYLATTTGTGPELYFTGSADGCPKTWEVATCGFGWTSDDIAGLAARPGVAALPQIYLGYQATQWAQLAAAHDFPLTGFLTEYQLDPDALSVPQASSAIRRSLAATGVTSRPGFVADFQRS